MPRKREVDGKSLLHDGLGLRAGLECRNHLAPASVREVRGRHGFRDMSRLEVLGGHTECR